MSDPVTVERRDRIAIVRFDRGGRANAMSFAHMDALADTALALAHESSLAALVLTGTGKIFSAGMDLRDEAFDRLGAMDLAEKRDLAEHGPRLARSWAALEMPTIAAVEGPCLGGGLALAAVCDFRVAGRSARFGAPEVQVAHNMGWHSVPRLVRLVGVQATRRLLLAGGQWSAPDALKLGFVDHVAEDGTALDEALALAERIAGQPAMAVRMVKRQIDAAAHGDDWALSALDKDQQIVAWMSDEFAAARQKFGGK